MTGQASRINLLAKTPARTFSLASGIPSDRSRRRRRRRRRPQCPLLAAASCGSDGGKRSIPVTPLLQWKFAQIGSGGGALLPKPCGKTLVKHIKAGGKQRPAASARRLAAGIWHLQLPKVVGGWGASLDLEVDASASLLSSSIERVTKWDPSNPKISKDAFGLYDSLKLVEGQKTNKFSIVSALRSELELARSKVSELEEKSHSSMKKLHLFMRKFEEEKAAWRRREHEKIRSVIDAMKEDLNRERKNAQIIEIMNTKLVNELSKVKLSTKQLSQEYEKERKARELMEEVCSELAKEIGDDKAEVEALKMESVKTREEVEEERKMLQMAEVWREERVQMKLIDAKLTLDEKYSKLSMLQAEIEAFLRSRSWNNHDVSEIKQAKSFNEAVRLVTPVSDTMFSIFEEHQSREQVNNAKEIEQCFGSVTPEANGFSEDAMKRYNNMMFDGNCDAEDDSGWETVSHAEEQDSCKSPDGSEPSVNGVFVGRSPASVNSTDCDEQRDDGKQNSEISEVCSLTTRRSTKKSSSLCKLWKSSRRSNAEDIKQISFELANGKFCNGKSLFNATSTPARKSADTGNWSSSDLINPHITNGMKGDVEWLQSTKKQNLKTKLMESRFQSQKVQLRQVLKQKI